MSIQISLLKFCDASRIGIGGALMNRNKNEPHLVWIVSRLLTETEKRYPITEQEALSVVWCLKKLRTFLLGYKFTIFTDHKALCCLMEKKDLSDRLARWSLALQEYNFNIARKPGIKHRVPDYLSRYPGPTRISEEEPEYQLVNNISILSPTLSSKQRRDRNLNRIIQAIENWEEHPQIDISGYVLERDVLFKLIVTESGPKLVPVIPDSLIDKILFTLHDDAVAGHLGMNKTLNKVRAHYYWPGMSSDVKQYVQSCRDCQGRKHECRPEPGLLVPIEVGGPYERVGLDLLGPFPRTTDCNTNIIVATDCLTRWAECSPLEDATSDSIACFSAQNIVCRFDAPAIFLTDQGKAFQSKLIESIYKIFSAKHHRTSAYHPATNGLTERFNKTLTVMLSMYVNSQHTDWDKAI